MKNKHNLLNMPIPVQKALFVSKKDEKKNAYNIKVKFERNSNLYASNVYSFYKQILRNDFNNKE